MNCILYVIIKTFTEGETLDDEAINPIFDMIEWQEIYKWNGEKAIFYKKSKVKKYRKKM